MIVASKVAQQELRARASESWTVAYLGGHPGAPGSAVGLLAVTGSDLVFSGDATRTGYSLGRRELLTFKLPLLSITEVEGLTGDELKRAPQNYLFALGFGFGLGGKRKHPLSSSSKIEALLRVKFADGYGDTHDVAFANPPGAFGPFRSFPRADAITSARFKAREAQPSP